MKRPNIRRMQRHRARSVPDRVSQTFNHDLSVYMDEHPGVRKFINDFVKDMKLKHGHEPHIKITSFLNWIDGDTFTIELQYDGEKTNERITLEKIQGSVLTPNEVNRRMRGILYNGL